MDDHEEFHEPEVADEGSVMEVAESREIHTSSMQDISTTEYLPCMLHVNSPIGILPRYSSWSLVCLGPSSLYSHNAGLSDQPGFLTGSAFLLPWDVTVRVQHAETMANEGRRPYAGYFDAFYTCLATVAISNVHSDAGTLERENAPKTIIRNLQSRFLSASNTSVHEGTDL